MTYSDQSPKFSKIGLALIVAILALVAAFFALQSKDSNSKSTSSTDSTTQTKHTNKHPLRSVSDSQLPKKPRSHNRPKANDYINTWDKSTSGLSGKNLNQAQWAVAKKAVENLSGMDIAAFIEHIESEAGRDVLDWVLCIGGARLISAMDREDAKNWVLDLKSPTTQRDLLFFMGTSYTQDDAEDYLAKIKSTSSRASFLSGFCVNLLSANPEAAIETFMRLRPPDSDPSALTRILDILPESTNFESVFNSITNTSGQKNSDAHDLVLGSWSNHNPKAAADFIVKSQDTNISKSLQTVINRWIDTSPNDAEQWIDSMDESENKSLSIQTFCIRTAPKNPERSWNLATKITDQKKRSDLLNTIYREWSKFDKEAADEALRSSGPSPAN